jgi:hypothetical protein
MVFIIQPFYDSNGSNDFELKVLDEFEFFINETNDFSEFLSEKNRFLRKKNSVALSSAGPYFVGKSIFEWN